MMPASDAEDIPKRSNVKRCIAVAPNWELNAFVVRS
jgi:hypothetical protein